MKRSDEASTDRTNAGHEVNLKHLCIINPNVVGKGHRRGAAGSTAVLGSRKIVAQPLTCSNQYLRGQEKVASRWCCTDVLLDSKGLRAIGDEGSRLKVLFHDTSLALGDSVSTDSKHCEWW